jgi:6-phosphogluconolactonase
MTTGASTIDLAFIGSYAPADRPGIHAMQVTGSGDLRLLASWAGVQNPSFVRLDPSGGNLYVVSETGVAADGIAGTVHAFRIERGADSTDLVAINSQDSGGDHPCHIGIDADRARLAVSNYGSGTVSVFPIRPDGGLGEVGSLARHSGTGPHPDRQEGPHCHSSCFSPDGRFLVVADLGIDRLMVYRVDGTAIALAHEVSTAAGAGPRHVSFHPDGRHLLVVNELDNTVSLFGYRSDDGGVSLLQTLSTLPDGVMENTAADIHLSPTGRHVYVSNRGHDSLAVYGFDPVKGMTLTAIRSCGGRRPRGFALTQDGHVLVANRSSDEVVSLPLRDASDVGEPVSRLPVSEPSCVAVTPG